MKYNEFDFKIAVMSFLKNLTGTFYKLEVISDNKLKIIINKNTVSRAKYKQLIELSDSIIEKEDVIDITDFVINNCFKDKTIEVLDSDQLKISIN